ncbi:MAG: NAD(P)-binding protein, partial [Archaeoglobaceae archaeon]
MICIVGGGLAGLSIGYLLGKKCVVFEANRVGGLLRSEKVEGFTFDTGGSHILFSSDEKILKEMLQ